MFIGIVYGCIVTIIELGKTLTRKSAVVRPPAGPPDSLSGLKVDSRPSISPEVRELGKEGLKGN